MGDNINVTPGTGKTIAADEISSVLHQRVKIEHGADGSATDVSTASPLPVDLRTDNVGGIEVVQDTAADFNVTEANSAAIKTAVETIDNAISGSEMQVDVVTAPDIDINDISKGTQTNDVKVTLDSEAVVLDTGTAEIGNVKISDGTEQANVNASNELQVADDTARTSLGTIAGDTTSIDGKITACDTGSIAGTVTANAGTNLNTSALALESGGNLDTIAGDTTSIDGKITACNTGDVTVGAALPAGTNLIGNVKISDGTETANVNASNQLEVNVNTASGLEVVQATAADLNVTEANSATIAGDTTSIDGKITACNTGAVVLAAGTAAYGKLAANDGVDIGDVTINNAGGVEVVQDTAADLNCTEASASDIKTSVQVMDDWDATHDSAASADGVQLMGAYDSTHPAAVADGDAVRILTDQYGRIRKGREPELFQATITSADASSATQVKAKTADKKMYILSVVISTDTEMSVQLQDDAGTPNVLMEQIYLAANGGMAMTFPDAAPLVVTTNQDLDVLASTSGNISVLVTGYLAE